MGKGGDYSFKAYLLTNGRSTFKYSLMSLQNQKDEMEYEIIENKGMEEAMNHIINTTKASHILKVDDDFFLHPYAIMYMKTCVKAHLTKPAMWHWRLWEDYTRRAVQCIKIYDVEKVKQIGGFRANAIGQIDRNFKKDVKAKGYRIWSDTSCLAIHACATWEENLKYEEIWTQNAKSDHVKDSVRRKGMRKYNKTVAGQYKALLPMLNSSNLRSQSPFFRWCRQKKVKN